MENFKVTLDDLQFGKRKRFARSNSEDSDSEVDLPGSKLSSVAFVSESYHDSEENEDAKGGFGFKKPAHSNFGDKEESFLSEEEEIWNAESNTSNYSGPSLNTAPTSVGKPVASWEKHTLGFGSKMLQKMGWKPGEGLGQTRSGIVAPVEVKVRPKGKGLAYGGMSEQVKDEVAIAEEKKQTEDRKSAWTKKNKKKKVQVLKTVDDILRKQGVKTVTETIIDMRGPESKEMPTASFSSKNHHHFDSEYFHEIRYNVKLICDRTEQVLNGLARNLSSDETQMKHLESQIEMLNSSSKELPVKIDRMSRISELMKAINGRITKQSQIVPLNFKDFNATKYQDLLQPLLTEYQQEFKENELDVAVISLLLPHIKRMYIHWNALEIPHLGFDIIEGWKQVLEPPDTNCIPDPKAISCFGKMILNCWFPSVRATINNHWNPIDPDILLAFLETWKRTIPKLIMSQLTREIILPKIKRAIENWNSKVEHTPLHTWIHPWLPSFGEEFLSLYPTIRNKLSLSLQNWKPSDLSVIKLLEPWQHIFSRKEMDEILNSRVVPKLQNSITRDLVIDPRNQDLAPLDNLFAWKNVLPLDTIANILEGSFFHKWLHFLYRWLSLSDETEPYFEDISQWYTDWKAIFPLEVAEHPIVHAQLTIALNMMNHCMTMGSVDGFADGVYASKEPPVLHSGTTSRTVPVVALGIGQSTTRVTFRDTIEHYASKHNILFMPLNRKTKDGRQLYKFGKVPIYLEGSVIFAEMEMSTGRDVEYVPVSLDQLPEMQSYF